MSSKVDQAVTTAVEVESFVEQLVGACAEKEERGAMEVLKECMNKLEMVNMSRADKKKPLGVVCGLARGRNPCKDTVVSWLLDNGASPEEAQALEYAVSANDVATCRVLMRRGVALKSDMVRIGAGNGCIQVLHLLLAHGADVNVQNADGLTPIFMVAQCGHVGAMRLLLAHGADPRLALTDGHKSIVRLLLRVMRRRSRGLPQLPAKTTARLLERTSKFLSETEDLPAARLSKDDLRHLGYEFREDLVIDDQESCERERADALEELNRNGDNAEADTVYANEMDDGGMTVFDLPEVPDSMEASDRSCGAEAHERRFDEYIRRNATSKNTIADRVLHRALKDAIGLPEWESFKEEEEQDQAPCYSEDPSGPLVRQITLPDGRLSPATQPRLRREGLRLSNLDDCIGLNLAD